MSLWTSFIRPCVCVYVCFEMTNLFFKIIIIKKKLGQFCDVAKMAILNVQRFIPILAINQI